MRNIIELLSDILNTRYGKDVRQSIHDAIHQCYEDGKAGSLDLAAREQINILSNDKMGYPDYANSKILHTISSDNTKGEFTIEEDGFIEFSFNAKWSGIEGEHATVSAEIIINETHLCDVAGSIYESAYIGSTPLYPVNAGDYIEIYKGNENCTCLFYPVKTTEKTEDDLFENAVENAVENYLDEYLEENPVQPGVDGKSIMVFTSSNVSDDGSTYQFDRFKFAVTPQIRDLVIVPNKNMALVEVTEVGQTVVYGTFIGNLQGEMGPQGEKGDKGDTGATGPQGPAGSDATVTTDSITTALGFTPAKEETVSKLQEEIADQQEQISNLEASILADVLEALGKPIVGSISDDNVITLEGDIADGTYSLRWITKDKYVDICSFTFSESSDEEIKNWLNFGTTELGGTEIYNGKGWAENTRWSASGNKPATLTGGYLTGIIPVNPNDTVYTYELTYLTSMTETAYYVVYHSDGSITEQPINGTTNDYTDWVEHDENGVFIFTVPSDGVGVRFGCFGIVDTSVITINQYPIV